LDPVSLIGIALALAMDAFAVALGAGVILQPMTGRHLFRLAFHFGLFQGLMPIIGWLVGAGLQVFIQRWAPWIAFALLAFIGGRMIYEALSKDPDQTRQRDPTRGATLVLLSIATSIDALAVGFSLALLEVRIWYPALVIALFAGVLTLIGMLLGRRIGAAWGSRVEIVGGLILLAIGSKILFL
jgi:putative Mn2+ efflux pump MntP